MLWRTMFTPLNSGVLVVTILKARRTERSCDTQPPWCPCLCTLWHYLGLAFDGELPSSFPVFFLKLAGSADNTALSISLSQTNRNRRKGRSIHSFESPFLATEYISVQGTLMSPHPMDFPFDNGFSVHSSPIQWVNNGHPLVCPWVTPHSWVGPPIRSTPGAFDRSVFLHTHTHSEGLAKQHSWRARPRSPDQMLRTCYKES